MREALARTAVIVVPMLPPREVSPNWRGHWSVKQRAVREFREAAGWAARAWSGVSHPQWSLFPRGAVMDVEIAWCCGRRRLDDDNAWASMKAARDGVADVLFGGEDRFIVQGELRQTKGDGFTTITLREGR